MLPFTWTSWHPQEITLDPGAEGGVRGGEIVAQGTPEEVVQEPRSYTGRYLKPLLKLKAKEPVAAE